MRSQRERLEDPIVLNGTDLAQCRELYLESEKEAYEFYRKEKDCRLRSMLDVTKSWMFIENSFELSMQKLQIFMQESNNCWIGSNIKCHDSTEELCGIYPCLITVQFFFFFLFG